MPTVPEDRYASIVCYQVLEHVSYPWQVLIEMRRVLSPGGHLLLSVPHLSRRHEVPHDYFRFTPGGAVSLLEDAGFDVVLGPAQLFPTGIVLARKPEPTRPDVK